MQISGFPIALALVTIALSSLCEELKKDNRDLKLIHILLTSSGFLWIALQVFVVITSFRLILLWNVTPSDSRIEPLVTFTAIMTALMEFFRRANIVKEVTDRWNMVRLH